MWPSGTLHIIHDLGISRHLDDRCAKLVSEAGDLRAAAILENLNDQRFILDDENMEPATHSPLHPLPAVLHHLVFLSRRPAALAQQERRSHRDPFRRQHRNIYIGFGA